MNILKVPFVLISIFSAGYCQAADNVITICSVQSSLDGRAHIAPCGAWTTKNNCPSTGGWLTWDAKTEGGKLMFSIALTALAAKLPVTVRTDGSSCDSYDVAAMLRINNI